MPGDEGSPRALSDDDLREHIRRHVSLVDTWELRLNGIRESLHELHGMLVSMRLRERRKAGDVSEQEGGFGGP